MRLPSHRFGYREILELHLMQSCIIAFLRQQLGMVAELDNASMIKDNNFIGMFNGGEAVGVDQCGSVAHEILEGCLNMALRLGVQGGSGFI